jgi:hypothetical protein
MSRQFLFALIVLAAQTGFSNAEGLLDGIATNPVLQSLGSVVTSQQPTLPPIVPSTVPAPPPVPRSPPVVVTSNPNYDPFHSPQVAPNLPPPAISQGIPKPPPAGLTGGTVCQNGICQLAPVPTQPAVTATVAPALPYPVTSTFPPPAPASSPQGVSINVAPTEQSSDLSKTRAEVLQALSKP